MFLYTAYGLIIHSELYFPELKKEEEGNDVVVRLGSIKEYMKDKNVPAGHTVLSDTETCLVWEEAGRFFIRSGHEIIVEPAPNVEDQVLRLLILGPCLAALLQQRGHLVLHASSVAIDGQAVAFLGGPGWGKSTLAALLQARGHEFISDDITPVLMDRGPARITFSFPQMKVWPETAIFLGKDPETLPRIHPGIEKRAFRTAYSASGCSFQLGRIYILGEGPGIAIEAVSKQETLIELVRHTYGIRFLDSSTRTSHFLQCFRLLKSVPVRRLKRPQSLERVQELAEAVEGDYAQVSC